MLIGCRCQAMVRPQDTLSRQQQVPNISSRRSNSTQTYQLRRDTTR